MSENQNPTTTPANLATARKEQAAARKAAKATHPTAKAAPAAEKPATNTDAPKPRKVAVRSDKPALKWSKVDGGGLNAVADGVEYAVVKSGEKFAATVKKANAKPQVIKDGISDGAAYALLRKVYTTGELPVIKSA